jgi:sugar phosphate isomerase/epimerase
MYRPLGQGDVDADAIAQDLARQGYDGWSVLEQDTILAEELGTRDRCATCPPGGVPALRTGRGYNVSG